MRVAFDSNILAYLAGVSHGEADDAKIGLIRSAVRKLKDGVTFVAPLQALGELFVVLRRSGAEAAAARQTVLEFTEAFGTAATGDDTLLAALDLVVDHKLQYWDALIVSAAVEAGCTLLLSEDMQHGFVVRGMTVVNPLAAKTHPKLEPLLAN
ncbi:MAG: PIN domain-containing protein [Novosphingobium sp.]